MKHFTKHQQIQILPCSQHEEVPKAHHWFRNLSLRQGNGMGRRVLFMLGLFLVLGLNSRASYGQVNEEQEWTFLKEAEGVQVYYLFDVCSGKKKLNIKLKNDNPVAKRMKFKVKINDNDGNFEESISAQEVNLLPNKALYGSCEATESNGASNLIMHLEKEYLDAVVSVSFINY